MSHSRIGSVCPHHDPRHIPAAAAAAAAIVYSSRPSEQPVGYPPNRVVLLRIGLAREGEEVLNSRSKVQLRPILSRSQLRSTELRVLRCVTLRRVALAVWSVWSVRSASQPAPARLRLATHEPTHACMYARMDARETGSIQFESSTGGGPPNPIPPAARSVPKIPLIYLSSTPRLRLIYASSTPRRIIISSSSSYHQIIIIAR
jgi:hypothetical protein